MLRKSKANFCSIPKAPLPRQKERLCDVEVNGKACRALIDTGSTQTLIKGGVVDMHECGSVVQIECVHGDVRPYSTTEIMLTVQGENLRLQVGVVGGLPYDVGLGTDIPMVAELLRAAQQQSMVVTRSQAKGLVQTSTDQWLQELPYWDVSIEGENFPSRGHKSRRQRREAKQMGTARKLETLLPSVQSLGEDFVQLQREDGSLAGLFDRAEKGSEAGTMKEFAVIDQRLYKIGEEGKQLVVPTQFRAKVMELGRSIPMAGHLGREKTLARIQQRFFWPGITQEVAEFCSSCPECQVTVGIRVSDRAPLCPLPVIDEPFSRIAMDIVGPLLPSSSGNRFILVICDYATRYPEAFPLRSIKAKQVAKALGQLITRVGIPREIITDQGTNFMSTLLKHTYKFLGIKAIRSTPYHPQTDGLVERFNQTLKRMLRRFVNETGKDWDAWLPYLLFAYREVPQASTGFSPFELLYGKVVRGPLDVLKETWEEPSTATPKNVISYVLQMRDKLAQYAVMVKENMAEAQKIQKGWYDRHSREREYTPGQKVLLLLPSSEHKLLAKWQGPFEVVRKVGPVTYEVNMEEKGRANQVFHVKLLKAWRERKQTVGLVCKVEDEEITEGCFPSDKEEESKPNLSHLSKERKAEVEQVLNRPGLFTKKPGLTSVVEHNIHLQDSTPIRQHVSYSRTVVGHLKRGS